MKIGSDSNKNKINTVKCTDDMLFNRSGVRFMLRYLAELVFLMIEDHFSHPHQSCKGKTIGE